jgi:hypothetical protein
MPKTPLDCILMTPPIQEQRLVPSSDSTKLKRVIKRKPLVPRYVMSDGTMRKCSSEETILVSAFAKNSKSDDYFKKLEAVKNAIDDSFFQADILLRTKHQHLQDLNDMSTACGANLGFIISSFF